MRHATTNFISHVHFREFRQRQARSALKFVLHDAVERELAFTHEHAHASLTIPLDIKPPV